MIHNSFLLMQNTNSKPNLILPEISDSGSWTQISWCKCENLSFCSPVTGSLESCCPPDTSQVKMASCGTACSTEDTLWPSDLHACPLLDCEAQTSSSPARVAPKIVAAGQCRNSDCTWICYFFFLIEFLHQMCTLLWQLCGTTSREEDFKPQYSCGLFMQRFYCHI